MGTVPSEKGFRDEKIGKYIDKKAVPVIGVSDDLIAQAKERLKYRKKEIE